MGAALHSTSSNRSHAVSFYCCLALAGSPVSIKSRPLRVTGFNIWESARPPSRLAFLLTKRVTMVRRLLTIAVAVAQSGTPRFPSALGRGGGPTWLAVDANFLIRPRQCMIGFLIRAHGLSMSISRHADGQQGGGDCKFRLHVSLTHLYGVSEFPGEAAREDD
jgi:hypothetical protein